jgi:hypothetical protein
MNSTREAVWKIVFNVVNEHAYYGSRELIKQLEAARERDANGPLGNPLDIAEIREVLDLCEAALSAARCYAPPDLAVAIEERAQRARVLYSKLKELSL